MKLGRCKLKPGDELTIIGWGNWENSPAHPYNKPDHLREGHITFHMYDNYDPFDGTDDVCNSDTCGIYSELDSPSLTGTGDSGGPVFLKGHHPHDDLLCGFVHGKRYRDGEQYQAAISVEYIHDWIAKSLFDWGISDPPKLKKRPYRLKLALVSISVVAVAGVFCGIYRFRQGRRLVCLDCTKLDGDMEDETDATYVASAASMELDCQEIADPVKKKTAVQMSYMAPSTSTGDGLAS